MNICAYMYTVIRYGWLARLYNAKIFTHSRYVSPTNMQPVKVPYTSLRQECMHMIQTPRKECVTAWVISNSKIGQAY